MKHTKAFKATNTPEVDLSHIKLLRTDKKKDKAPEWVGLDEVLSENQTDQRVIASRKISPKEHLEVCDALKNGATIQLLLDVPDNVAIPIVITKKHLDLYMWMYENILDYGIIKSRRPDRPAKGIIIRCKDNAFPREILKYGYSLANLIDCNYFGVIYDDRIPEGITRIPTVVTKPLGLYTQEYRMDTVASEYAADPEHRLHKFLIPQGRRIPLDVQSFRNPTGVSYRLRLFYTSDLSYRAAFMADDFALYHDEKIFGDSRTTYLQPDHLRTARKDRIPHFHL